MRRTLFHLATSLATFGLGVTLTALWLAPGAAPVTDDAPSSAAPERAYKSTAFAPPLALTEMPDAPVPLAVAEQPCEIRSDGTTRLYGWNFHDDSDAGRLSTGMRSAMTIDRPPPVYPANAKAMGVSGVVVVMVTINECGGVESATPVSGPPLLRPAAVEAARRSRFVPAQQSGRPVKVLTKIAYNFLIR